jgi:hypothetical protein
MVVRSIQSPVYSREKKSGLPGDGPKIKSFTKEPTRSFEEYLKDSFQGEVVQDGLWFSPRLTELSKSHLQKI